MIKTLNQHLTYWCPLANPSPYGLYGVEYRLQVRRLGLHSTRIAAILQLTSSNCEYKVLTHRALPRWERGTDQD